MIIKNKIFQGKFVFIFATILAMTFWGCKKEELSECGSSYDVSNCYTDAPKTLMVKLELTQTEKPVHVRVYVGDFDNGELYDDFYTTNAMESYYLKVGRDYAATAEYIDGKDTILVIDGEELKNHSCKLNNQYECYDWDKTMTLDLQLKK